MHHLMAWVASSPRSNLSQTLPAKTSKFFPLLLGCFWFTHRQPDLMMDWPIEGSEVRGWLFCCEMGV